MSTLNIIQIHSNMFTNTLKNTNKPTHQGPSSIHPSIHPRSTVKCTLHHRRRCSLSHPLQNQFVRGPEMRVNFYGPRTQNCPYITYSSETLQNSPACRWTKVRVFTHCHTSRGTGCIQKVMPKAPKLLPLLNRCSEVATLSFTLVFKLPVIRFCLEYQKKICN